MFLHPKFSHSPPKIFRWTFLVIYLKKLLSIQAILKRNFHPKFSDDFFSHCLPNKHFSPPNFFGRCSGLQDFYTFLLFLSKRSRKVPVRHDLLLWYCYTNIQNSLLGVQSIKKKRVTLIRSGEPCMRSVKQNICQNYCTLWALFIP